MGTETFPKRGKRTKPPFKPKALPERQKLDSPYFVRQTMLGGDGDRRMSQIYGNYYGKKDRPTALEAPKGMPVSPLRTMLGVS
jgi:hypothetical protein